MTNGVMQRVGQADTTPGPQQSYFIECATCGNEPSDQSDRPRHACPKCHSRTWQRVYRPEARTPLAPLFRPRPCEDAGKTRAPVVRTARRVYLAAY